MRRIVGEEHADTCVDEFVCAFLADSLAVGDVGEVRVQDQPVKLNQCDVDVGDLKFSGGDALGELVGERARGRLLSMLCRAQETAGTRWPPGSVAPGLVA